MKKRKIHKFIATGYGGHLVRKAAYTLKDSACIARGAWFQDRRIKTVIDAGGLFIKVITIDESGFLEQGYENEKCAAGSGRFLEMIAESIDIPFSEISQYASQSLNPYVSTSTCAVFAESDIITQINTGRHGGDIIAGVINSIAAKTASLVQGADARGPMTLTGGLAKVSHFRNELIRRLGHEIVDCSIDPRLLPAYGAAILAQGAELNRRH
jgi:predicted CoA-substrate-specific enzyme activase